MTPQNPFDENLKRMLQSTLDEPTPAFQEQLVRDVLREIAHQRRTQCAQPWWRQLLAGQFAWRTAAYGLATCVLIMAGVVWLRTNYARESVGRVSCLYGAVSVQRNGTSRTLSETVDLRSGQRVKTQAGSQAQIVLPDQSQLLSDPRTSLQIAATAQGPRILLEEGTIRIVAAKQPPGKNITIQSGQAQARVLGTKLDVRLVQKPSGGCQTQIRVLSGRVEMESGGQKVMLLQGTKGVADQDQPPVRSSLVPEVNELLKLLSQTTAMAKQTGRLYGSPAIIDLATSTVWVMVPGQALHPSPAGTATLKLRQPAFGAKAYTLEGAEIGTEGSGDLLRLDFPGAPSEAVPEHFILKIPGVQGLAKATSATNYECEFPGSATGELRFVRFRLPESARVENLSASTVQTLVEAEKQTITVTADVSLPRLY